MDVPLIPAARRGYRVWRCRAPDPPILLSMTRETTWITDTVVADCIYPCPPERSGFGHTVPPDLNCSCGIYALHSPSRPELFPYMFQYAPLNSGHGETPILGLDGVFGVINATGRCVVGRWPPLGFRAERAQITALAYCTPDSVDITGVVTLATTEEYLGLVRMVFHCDYGYHLRAFTFASSARTPYAAVRSALSFGKEASNMFRVRYPRVQVFRDIRDLVTAFPPTEGTSCVLGDER